MYPTKQCTLGIEERERVPQNSRNCKVGRMNGAEDVYYWRQSVLRKEKKAQITCRVFVAIGRLNSKLSFLLKHIIDKTIFGTGKYVSDYCVYAKNLVLWHDIRYRHLCH